MVLGPGLCDLHRVASLSSNRHQIAVVEGCKSSFSCHCIAGTQEAHSAPDPRELGSKPSNLFGNASLVTANVRVGLLVDAGDELIVTDLKRARSRWSQDQAVDSAGQLLLYAELVRRLLPGKALRLQFAVLTKTKEPIVDQHEVRLSPGRLDRSLRIVDCVWKAIAAEHFYPSPSPMNCPGCQFREPRRRWTG